jgi:opacity protein-like surface antigen
MGTFKRLPMSIAVLLISLTASSSLYAQANQWMFGVGVGPSFPTGSFRNVQFTDPFGDRTSMNLDLKTGPLINGKIGYAVNDTFTLGFSAEWETHKIAKTSVQDFLADGTPIPELITAGGRLHTFSLMPFVEVRPIKFGNLSLYLGLAAGGNINRVGSKSSTVNSFEVGNSAAFKVSGGLDYFFTKSLAFNTEVAWKYNRGSVKIKSTENPSIDTPPDVATGDSGNDGNRVSPVSLLFGLRYYY